MNIFLCNSRPLFSDLIYKEKANNILICNVLIQTIVPFGVDKMYCVILCFQFWTIEYYYTAIFCLNIVQYSTVKFLVTCYISACRRSVLIQHLAAESHRQPQGWW